PPPKAIMLGRERFPASSSRSASTSAWRNLASPDSSKICSILRPSRATTWSSRSAKSHPMERLNARPTLVFPAPMNPTRNTSPDADPSPACMPHSGSWVGLMAERARIRFSAFLEVDFTTHGEQLNRRGGFVHGACEGTPCLYHEGGVFRFEGEIVLDLALFRTGAYVERSVRRSRSFDVAGMAAEHVNPGIAEIAVVANLSAGGIDLHQRPVHRGHDYISADGGHFDVTVVDICQRDWTIEGLNMDMRVGDIPQADIRGRSFYRNVALQFLGSQRPGCSVKGDRGLDRNLDVVFDLAALHI